MPLWSKLSRRVLVVGDVMLDRYVIGGLRRLSPEAPVPLLRKRRSWTSPGGAGNVAAGLAALGCRVTIAGLVGRDAAAYELRAALHVAGVDDLLLRPATEYRTVTKTRFLSEDFHQLLRLDDEIEGGAAEALRLAEQATARFDEFDVVVLADYDKGSLTSESLRRLIDAAAARRLPVIVDPKKRDFRVYRGATILTPNLPEAEAAVGRPLPADADAEAAAKELRESSGAAAVLITRGRHGMTGFDDRGAFHVPARVVQVADVTGAGDTVVAALAATYAGPDSLRDSCRLANLAGGIAVSHPGTYVVTAEELQATLDDAAGKLVDREQARRAAQRARAQGRKIVFTNGCFDLLHVGHLHSLREAKSHGDLLVVGLNSDTSVRALKGAQRPINAEQGRAELLCGLACVDMVVVFDETTPEELIRELEPDVLAKGEDYKPEEIVGAEFVTSRGGSVVRLSLIPGVSTTQLLDRGAGLSPE